MKNCLLKMWRLLNFKLTYFWTGNQVVSKLLCNRFLKHANCKNQFIIACQYVMYCFFLIFTGFIRKQNIVTLQKHALLFSFLQQNIFKMNYYLAVFKNACGGSNVTYFPNEFPINFLTLMSTYSWSHKDSANYNFLSTKLFLLEQWILHL